MKTDSILQADVLDIIFENRNKDYGAYTLRKYYNNRLYKAMGITFCAAGIVCAFSFFQKHPQEIFHTTRETELTTPPVIKDKKPEKPKERQQPQIPAPQKEKTETQKFEGNFKITEDPDIADIPNLIEDVAIGGENATGEPSDIVPVIQKEPNGIASKPDSSVISVDRVTPLNVAEIMPAYPGGMEALRKFLEKNLSNPQDLNEEQTISVKIKFVVGYDGKLKDFQIVEDGGAAFNNEVIRVLKKMPAWIPGKTKGENVSVYFTIPVKFTSSE